MRYCEDQFLEVAQQHGLCRPSQTVLSLKDILELHASVVSPMHFSHCLCSAALTPCLVGCSVAVSAKRSVTSSQMGEQCASLACCSPNVQMCSSPEMPASCSQNVCINASRWPLRGCAYILIRG